MPPKLTKAERERLRQEEAERRAREEEEQRQQEEQEQQEREEREQREREKRERLKALEEARFGEESARVEEFVEGQKEALGRWKREQREKKQWEHYLSCSPLPDPSDERSLNTFLSLYEEDCGDKTIGHTLQGIGNCLTLSAEVEKLLNADGLPAPNEGESERYVETLSKMRSLVCQKLDQSTLHYLEEAEKHVDSETFNLRVEARLGAELTYLLWGNVVKNPRLKNFSFKEYSFTLELPKPLILADAAVRVLRLPFDPLSPQCQTYHCRKQVLIPGSATPSTKSGASGEAPDNQGDNETEEGESVEGEGGKSGTTSVRGGSAVTMDQAEAKSAVEVGEDSQSVPLSGGGKEGEGGEVEGGKTGEGGEQQPTQEGEAPPSTAGEGVRGGGGEEDEVDLRAFRVAGGPLVLELLEMPPQPKVVNSWTIRKVVSRDLTPYPYPAEVPRPPQSSQNTEGEEQQQAPPAPVPGSSTWPPVNISMQLPEHHVFSESPQLALWDRELKIWRTGGMEEVQFDLEERTVTFQTFYFSPLAVVVNRYTNMPYQSWVLLPLGPNHCSLTITGRISQITVEIKEQQCTLVHPSEEPALVHLLNKTSSARQLIQGLQKAGVNFFPEPDGDKYVKIAPKHAAVELSLYQHMALVCCAFAFQWSQWGGEGELGRSRVVLRAAESLGGQPADQLSWSVYVGGRRSHRLKITEDGSKFSLESPDGCEAHPCLFSALESEASGPAKERIKTTSPVHVEAVQQWLTATKILTYS